MDYCIGYDLLNEKDILVPAPLVIFKFIPNPPSVNPYAFYHTNGLASGNVMEEAICHALCEVIERDSTSISEFVSSAFQYHILRYYRKFIHSEWNKIKDHRIKKIY